MQFVDEQNDLTFLFRKIAQHSLEALFEFTAELRTCNQGAHIKRQNSLATQTLGNLVVNDALCKPFNYCCLADAGLADKDRVILGATLQYLDRATNLIVSPDDRVKLALLGSLSQVDCIFLERLPCILSVWVVDLLSAAELVNRLFDRAPHRAGLLHHVEQR